MRYSSSFSHRAGFFTKRKILTDYQALFFVLEEGILIFLIALQIYRILGIELANNSIYFLHGAIGPQNLVWLAGSFIFFIIGYLVVAKRDETVILIHKNFANALLASAKFKIQTTDRQVFIFVFAELAYATILAMAIYIYLDPDINILPSTTPKIFNYIGFAIFLGIGLLLFSHTKNFRELVYGPTPLQKRLHHGPRQTKRFTNSRTGSIRVAAKEHYKNRFLK